MFSGTEVPEGAAPLAQLYSPGTSSATTTRNWGTGRALLLGEVVGTDNRRYDIQLKGSGPTPYSRMGDGLAWLGPVLREYVVSEAMHALRIPTTRALAATLTGDDVIRETVLPGAVLTRVASSHLRVGTFQVFAHRGQIDELRQLTEYAIRAALPRGGRSDGSAARRLCRAGRADYRLDVGGFYPRRDEYRQQRYIRRDHRLRAMRLHGRVSPRYGFPARSIKWGVTPIPTNHASPFGTWRNWPRRFCNNWTSQRVPSKRRLRSCMRCLPRFEAAWTRKFGRKIGIENATPEDRPLIETLLTLMQEEGADFTNTFDAALRAALLETIS